MGKRVSHVELHDGFFIPGMMKEGGQFGKSLPAAGKTLENLEMTLNDNGSVEASWGKGPTRMTITIGAANIKFARHLTPEPVKTEKVVINANSKAQRLQESDQAKSE
jgi:hypothetical protein